MFKTMQIAIMILVCASFATAQSNDYKKYEFFAGYSQAVVVHGIEDDAILDDPEDYYGFNTSVTRNFSRYAGVKLDFSGHFRTRIIPFATSPIGIDLKARLYNVLGGLQIKDNSTDKTFKPFVHALVGVAHVRNRVHINNDLCVAIPCQDFTESDTGLAGVVGGGVDLRLSDRIDVRIIQIDYNPTRLFDASQRNLRIGFGIAFH